ncbi:hypothetical protein DEDE109153_16275 [Deinococcus deserti]
MQPTGLHQTKETEQRFMMSNLDLSGIYRARTGKRRWRIEAFFKTVKGWFGIASVLLIPCLTVSPIQTLCSFRS